MRVALVVDNPLRDLDGLVLLGWQLAHRGATAYLVPMYRQGFDIPGLRPDWVVANYVRPNNRELLALYRQLGIGVAILDTEGAAGKSGAEFASMVRRIGIEGLVDVYCLWGEDQFAAFAEARVLPEAQLRLTGCPRFDFCADPWRAALPAVEGRDFVLVNTNFPTVNPRFSTGRGDELRSMLQAGFDEAFAKRFIAEAGRAHSGMIQALTRVAACYPDTNFVLRPHPFEDPAPYAAIGASNVIVRQVGTVLEWLAAARVLIHQNCSTALEAVMLGVEPLSCEWLNSPALHLEGPTSVSEPIASEAALIERVGEFIRGAAAPPAAALAERRRALVARTYYRIDGRGAERVADVLFDAPRAPQPPPGRSLRALAAQATRTLLGFRATDALRRLRADPRRLQAVQAKAFPIQAVAAVVQRINSAVGGRVVATEVASSAYRNPALASGETVQLARQP